MKNVVITILAILVVALGGYVVYDKVVDKKDSKLKCDTEEKKEVKEVENKDTDISKSDVPATDMYALAVFDSAASLDYNIEFYMLKDGKLYYKFVKNWKDTDPGRYHMYTFDYNQDNYSNGIDTKNLTEYTGLSNIKRIKGMNTVSSGNDFNLLLITYDGKVYELDFGTFDEQMNFKEEFSLNEFELFKDYKVDDILDINIVRNCIDGEDCGSNKYKILLQDGTIVTK